MLDTHVVKDISNRPTIFLNSLSEIIDKYDGFIVDLWGVVHNGMTLYPGVLQCFQALQQQGKQVVFLSNAPRQSDFVKPALAKFGLTENLYQGIFTSGDEVHQCLRDKIDPWYADLGTRCFLLGAEHKQDDKLLEGLAIEQVAEMELADFILNTGPPTNIAVPEDFAASFVSAISNKLPMICANPDKEVRVGSKRLICAGEFAETYRQLGGYVRYHGKPYPSVYKSIQSFFKGIPVNRLLAIGDSFTTDIKGANDAGIDSALVVSGIHSSDLGVSHGQLPELATFEEVCRKMGVKPTFLLPGFIWSSKSL